MRNCRKRELSKVAIVQKQKMTSYRRPSEVVIHWVSVIMTETMILAFHPHRAEMMLSTNC